MNDLFNKNVILYILVLVCATTFGLLKFVIPEFNNISKQKQTISDTEAEIKVNKDKIQQSQATVAAQPAKVSLADLPPIKIYSSPYPGSDVENAAVDMVDQLIEMVRITQNRVVEISFSSKSDDPASPANILSLNITLNSSYMSLQNLLQKVYSWNYLAAIKNITIDPQQGDYNNLNIKLTIDLFISK